MKPLTIDSFKPDNIKAVSSDQKGVDHFNYTSIKSNTIRIRWR